jgi:hypothetical protein
MGGICSTHEEDIKCITYFDKFEEGDNLEVLVVDERKTFQLI